MPLPTDRRDLSMRLRRNRPMLEALEARQLLATITGSVSLDDAGQLSPLAGQTVYVDVAGSGVFAASDPSAVTASDGSYAIDNAPAGTYSLRVAPYPGETATTQSVTLTGGQTLQASPIDIVSVSPILPLPIPASRFPTTSPSLAAAEVQGLYEVILGRAADPAGLSSWSGAIRSGVSVSQVAEDFLTTPEYESGVIASYYENDLGRVGSSAEISSWVSYLSEGYSEESAAAIFFTSAEFNARFSSNANFVQALYVDILGRAGAASELSGWTGPLGSGTLTRAQVVQAILYSTESETRGATSIYQSVLDRAPDPGGLTSAVNGLESGLPLRNLAALFTSSGEFVSTAEETVQASTTLSVSGGLDYVFDNTGILYITDGPDIDRYDTNTGAYLPSFFIGGDLLGIDISPNDQTLAVADTTKIGIDLVSVATGAKTVVNFTPGGDSGTFSVAWGSDGSVLVTSEFNGSGDVPLRRYNPATNTTTVIQSVTQDTMLAASANRSIIGLAESNNSSGPVNEYSVAAGKIVATADDTWFNFEIATNPTGTQFVVPTYGGAYVYDVSGTTLVQDTIIGKYATYGPVAAVYSPTSHYLFTANYGTNPGVTVYDTNTFQPVAVIDPYAFPTTGNYAYQQGRMKISPDGQTLAVSVNGGTRVYNVGAYS